MINIIKRSIWASLKSDRALPALAIALEVCLVNSWLLWIRAWNPSSSGDAPLNLFSTTLVLSVSYMAAAYTGRHGLKTIEKLWVLAAVLAFLFLVLRFEHSGGYRLWDLDWATYAGDRIAFLVMSAFLGLYLLWRGTSLARDPITFERYQTLFTVGLSGLTVLLVLWSIGAAAGELQQPTGILGALIALYFFAGLSGLALSNYQAMRIESAMLGGRAQALSRRWLAMAFVIALAIVGFGLVLSSVFSVEFLSFLIGPLDIVATPILMVVYYLVIYPLSFVAAGLVYAMRWILSIIAREKTEPWENPLPTNYREMVSEQEANAFLILMLTIGKWMLLFLMFALIVFLLVRYYLKKQTAAKRPSVEETSESLWSVEQFLGDLRLFLLNLFGFLLWSLFGFLLRKPKPLSASVPAVPEAVASSGDDSRTLDAREIYRGLLWEGDRWGSPKAAGETPQEYAARLGQALSKGKEEIDHITADYMVARYGGEVLPPESMGLVNRAWRRFRTTLLGEPKT